MLAFRVEASQSGKSFEIVEEEERKEQHLG